MTRPGTYRIPDVLDHGTQVIGEVKNVGRLFVGSLRGEDPGPEK
jgi:hypothetical protein